MNTMGHLLRWGGGGVYSYVAWSQSTLNYLQNDQHGILYKLC
jgi:hypothetical protein